MPRTFDIRFARNSGLAALFEAPANSFQWKGAGRLSIDAQWLVFARSRSFLRPFAQLLRRVPAATLAGVYREGDSLRLEFAGSPRLVVPIWARDHADAAEIVRLMPTDRTVEVDGVQPRAKLTSRRNIEIGVVALVSLTIGVVATSMFGNRDPARDSVTTPTPAAPAAESDPASPRSIAPLTPAGTSAAIAATPGSSRAQPTLARSTSRLPDSVPAQGYPAGEAEVTPDAPTAGSASIEPGVAVPQPRSRFFRPEALALQSDYLYGNTADLESRWWALSVRLYNSPEFDDWRQRPLVDAQLGVSLNWRVSLANYAAAMNSRNQGRIDAARAELERANELTSEVLGYSY